MSLAENTSDVAARKRFARSAVANGTRLFQLESIDQRSGLARRYRDIIAEVTNDLGGPDLLSEIQRQLIRCCSAFAVISETIEGDLVQSISFDIGALGAIADRQRRIGGGAFVARPSRPAARTSGASSFGP